MTELFYPAIVSHVGEDVTGVVQALLHVDRPKDCLGVECTKDHLVIYTPYAMWLRAGRFTRPAYLPGSVLRSIKDDVAKATQTTNELRIELRGGGCIVIRYGDVLNEYPAQDAQRHPIPADVAHALNRGIKVWAPSNDWQIADQAIGIEGKWVDVDAKNITYNSTSLKYHVGDWTVYQWREACFTPF